MSLSETIPLGTIEERVALIEAIKELIISQNLPFYDDRSSAKSMTESSARNCATMFYTMYNEIAKNLKHE